MGVVLRVMTAVKCESALAAISMNIPNLVGALYLPHYDNRRFYFAPVEHGGLTHESLHHADVILRKHGWDRIIFRREFKQTEVVRLRVPDPGSKAGRNINIRKFIEVGIGV